MPVRAITPDYSGEMKDRVENFNGNQVVYVGWDKHLMFCAPFAFPLPPEMPFRALFETVMPDPFGVHPDWKKIDWDTVNWLLDDKPFVPQLDVSLQDQGIGHKSVVRFQTPGLLGFKNAGV